AIGHRMPTATWLTCQWSQHRRRASASRPELGLWMSEPLSRLRMLVISGWQSGIGCPPSRGLHASGRSIVGGSPFRGTHANGLSIVGESPSRGLHANNAVYITAPKGLTSIFDAHSQMHGK
ncbi:MAG: hypothetical protein SPH30_00515, partial [Prevotella sp.]|nr:hypothetical protein [Prevotella sp.]